MNDSTNEIILETFSKQFNIPKTHINVGIANLISCNNDYKTLFINRRLPNTGWSIIQIQNFLSILSIIDTNNKTSIDTNWYDDNSDIDSDNDNDNSENDTDDNDIEGTDDATGNIQQQQQVTNLDDTNERILAKAADKSVAVTGKSSLTQTVSKKEGQNVKNNNKNRKKNIMNQNNNTNNTTSSTNNIRWCSVGEREGRVYSSLILQRHYGLCHGIGRSGNIIESQPKAIGSTILYKLSLLLVVDVLKRCCYYTKAILPLSTKNIVLLPLCTGMTLSLVLSTIRNIDNKRIVLLQKQQQEQQEQQKQQSSSASTTTAPIHNDDKSDNTTATTGSTQQQQQYKQRNIVLWNRVDQKSCYKAIISAGLQCIVVPTQLVSNNNNNINNNNDSVITNINALQELLQKYNEQVLAIITTTSCFAPRVCDNIDTISKLLLHDYPTIYHIINNAYGIQCPIITKLINRSCTIGKVDAIISSTDKNFLVPVGGAIVVSPNSTIIDAIGKTYAGRASNAPIIDIFITLLSMGINGYQRLYNKRQSMISTFQKKLSTIASKYNGQLLHCPTNTISFAIALPYDTNSTLSKNSSTTTSNTNNISMIGSMLYQRCVSGTRVVSCNEIKTIDSETFIGYGSSIDNYPYPYLTAACAIGLTYNEMNEFFKRLDKTLYEYYNKKRKQNKQPNNSQKQNETIQNAQHETEEIEEMTVEKIDR